LPTYTYVSEAWNSTTGTRAIGYPNDYYMVAGATTTKTIYAGEDVVATIDTVASTSDTYYVHNDHLGGTNVVTNASGAVTQTLDYYPFGSTRIDSGTDVSSREFIGEITDEESGLSYLNARSYKSDIGRFISLDPVFLGDPKAQTLTDPQTLNSYSYASNNPIVKLDPTGKATYVWENGAGMSGIDTWDNNTYYESGDQAIIDNNAAEMRSDGNYANLGAFYNKVKNHGEWDYKNNSEGRSYYFFDGEVVDKETFGNRHYGYTGTAGGLGKTLLKSAAGAAQVVAGTSKRSYVTSYFDDPKDTTNIGKGIATYNANNKANPASAGKIIVQTTKNNPRLAAIERQIQSIRRQVNSLIRKLRR
jgi:RHS repeat-associated protein